MGLQGVVTYSRIGDGRWDYICGKSQDDIGVTPAKVYSRDGNNLLPHSAYLPTNLVRHVC